MSLVQQTLSQLSEAIRTADISQFKLALDLIPWADLPDLLDPDNNLTAQLFIGLLDYIHVNNLPQWIELVLSLGTENELLPQVRDVPSLSIKTQLFLLPQISVELLQWIDTHIKFPSFVNMITELGNYEESANLTLYLNRMYQVIPSGLINDYNFTVIWANLTLPLGDQPWELDKINLPLMRWLVDFNIDPVVPGNWIDGWTIDQRKEWAYQMEIELRNVTLANLPQWLNRIETDVNAQRMWGPFNRRPAYNYSYLPQNIDDLMFILQPMLYPHINTGNSPIDQLEDDDEVIPDWFEGYCHQCFRGITQREHALRQMLEYGGWSGCFCSWQCLVWSIPGADLPDGYEVITYEFVKITAQRMTEISGHNQVVPGLKLYR